LQSYKFSIDSQFRFTILFGEVRTVPK